MHSAYLAHSVEGRLSQCCVGHCVCTRVLSPCALPTAFADGVLGQQETNLRVLQGNPHSHQRVWGLDPQRQPSRRVHSGARHHVHRLCRCLATKDLRHLLSHLGFGRLPSIPVPRQLWQYIPRRPLRVRDHCSLSPELQV